MSPNMEVYVCASQEDDGEADGSGNGTSTASPSPTIGSHFGTSQIEILLCWREERLLKLATHTLYSH